VPAFERDAPAQGPSIQGFQGQSLRIDGKLFDGVLLTPLAALAWTPPRLAELTLADFEPLLALAPAPEFLLLGSGETMAFPPRALREGLDSEGLALEVMDSRAAARLWGMLRGEQRWIAAAIMPVQTRVATDER
jgi:uncharacterized protein